MYIAYLFFGFSIMHYIYGLFFAKELGHFELKEIFLFNLTILFSELNTIMIGLGLVWLAGRTGQHRLSWMLVGLIYGQLALIMMGMTILMKKNNNKEHLFSLLIPLFIMLILWVIFNAIGKNGINTILLIVLDLEKNIVYDLFRTVTSVFVLVIYFIMNLIFAVKMSFWNNSFTRFKSFVWVIATFFLGLVPVILYQQLTFGEDLKEGIDETYSFL